MLEMRRTAKETATILAVALNRSGQTRARVSAKTIRFIGKRENLRAAFSLEVAKELADYSWVLFELPTGGFGATQARSLAAAKPVTAKRWLSDDELKSLKAGKVAVEDFEAEALGEDPDSIDEDG